MTFPFGSSRSSSITRLQGFEVVDSRGFPTVAAVLTLATGQQVTAMVPSGASTGEYEALELRDGDERRYGGKGVRKAVSNINDVLAPALMGRDVLELETLDAQLLALDGTSTKSVLGANALLAVSIAIAQAGAKVLGIPLFQYLGGVSASRLPVPLVNIINGGAHATNSLDFQEFMIVPHGAERFSDAIRMASEIFQILKKNLKKKGLSTGVGDEGGFAPNLSSSEEALVTLMEAISDAGYQPGSDIALALDVAASEFYDASAKKYVLHKSTNESFSASDLVELYHGWSKKYPLVSIEDGLDQNDWEGWKLLTERLGTSVQLVGDDLFVTNPRRLQDGIDQGVGNSILIKLNQIGTVSETIKAIKLAHSAGYTSILSHRSGETEDTTIADLSVAFGSGQIKTGSVCRSERTAKYNRLLMIEYTLADRAEFKSPFKK
jgi:enolase